MKNDKVISIVERLEHWEHIYTSPRDEFYVSVSSRGRLKVIFKADSKNPIFLDFFDSVKFMSEVSKGFENMLDCAT